MTLSALRLSLARPGSGLFSGEGWSPDPSRLWLCADPVRLLTISAAAQVPSLLDDLDAALHQGLWAAGYLSYEAGAAFGLATHDPADWAPLAWFALYPPERCLPLDPADLPFPGAPVKSLGNVTLAVTSGEYHAALARIHDYLAAGDTYQVNYTCRARFPLALDPLDYFLALIRSHPVPYAAYLNLGDAQVLSLSPELLLSRQADTLTSRPMKGTRPRGRDAAEDTLLAAELTTSPKDRAENLMILDMVRNDLGRVALPGSVQVPTLFAAERYRSLWQMTSTVTARVSSGTSLREILAATFPGASITGAPKARTMQIIRELEPEPRGLYCGALGLLRSPDDWTLNLPIRTLVHRAGQCLLGLGAGIVWDSDPNAEYEETLLKSRFATVLLPDLRLWETLLLDADRRWAFLEGHLARLAASAAYWDFPCDLAALRSSLAACAASAAPPLVVRLELDHQGHATLHPREAPPPPPGPVRVRLSDHRTDSRDRFLYHKTSRRDLYDREREAALGEGYFEVLFCNEQGQLTEGAITNLFALTPDGWITAPVAAGLLPGLWRASFLEEVGAAEEVVTPADLLAAQRVVIGNSVRGAIEVGEILGGGGEVCFRRPG